MSSCDGTSKRRSCNDSLWWSNITRVIHIFRIEDDNFNQMSFSPESSMLSVDMWIWSEPVMPGIFLSQKSPAMQKKIGEVTLLQSIFFEGHFCHETSFQKKRCSFSSDETIQVVSKLAEYVCDKDWLPVNLWRGCEVNCGATAAAWDLRMIPGVPWHQAILLVGERLSYNPWGSLVSFFQPFLLIEAWDLRNEACPFAASFQDGL